MGAYLVSLLPDGRSERPVLLPASSSEMRLFFGSWTVCFLRTSALLIELLLHMLVVFCLFVLLGFFVLFLIPV